MHFCGVVMMGPSLLGQLSLIEPRERRRWGRKTRRDVGVSDAVVVARPDSGKMNFADDEYSFSPICSVGPVLAIGRRSILNITRDSHKIEIYYN